MAVGTNNIGRGNEREAESLIIFLPFFLEALCCMFGTYMVLYHATRPTNTGYSVPGYSTLSA